MKFLEKTQALVLRHVARNRLSVNVVSLQHLFETLGLPFGVHEHHGALGVVLAQQAHQQRNLFFHGRVINRLAHQISGDFLRLDAHQFRVVHVLVRQLQHALRQRR